MRKIILSALLIVAIASLAQASIFVPSWRGDAGTTYQEWNFPTDDNPVVANINQNPYGTPVAHIGGDFPRTNWYGEYQGAEGVWKTEDMITLDIPNTPNTDIDTYKNIVVQVAYLPIDNSNAFAQIAYKTASDQDIVAAPVYSETLTNGYTYSRWEIHLEPNPNFENIYVLPPECDCGIYVDCIAVDTICDTNDIPEPTTIALFGIAGLLLRRKK